MVALDKTGLIVAVRVTLTDGFGARLLAVKARVDEAAATLRTTAADVLAR